ncbi:MAG: cytochrome c biogenesis protein CcmE [Gammaproteobacteria bacterium]|nr:cytochrome c biogenesis protein CcmE [Gammaproteobacteria bacterium]
MRRVRQRRLAVVLFVVAGATATLSFALLALQEDVGLFYEPARVTNGEAPLGVDIRAGGIVREGSVDYEEEGLGVTFSITDYQGHECDARDEGPLPASFNASKGIMVRGQLTEHGLFNANEVLAKHDENYVPHETRDIVADRDCPPLETADEAGLRTAAIR